MGWSIALGVVCILIGLFLFFKPEWFWAITERWKSYRAEEPSDFYKTTTRIGGALFAAMGVGFALLPLFLR